MVVVDKVISGRGRGVRMFSFLTTWQGRILNEAAEHHKMPLADARKVADAARRLATKGGYADSWARTLAAGSSISLHAVMLVRPDACQVAQIIKADEAGRPDFAGEEAAQFLKRPFHPFMVVLLSALFEDVWKKCASVMTVNTKE
jgi:hypothetical protein